MSQLTSSGNGPNSWSDNTCVVALSENRIHHSKMKQVEIDLFFIREKVNFGEIVVNFVPANEQVANILTKPLTEKYFVPCEKKLRVFSDKEIQDMTSPSCHLHT